MTRIVCTRIIVLSFLMLFQVLPVTGHEKQKEKEWTGKLSDGRILTRNELENILLNHKKWVKTHEKEGKRADLSGAILTLANLSGARLYQANLSGADLNGADLSKAELYQADLSRAILHEADLSGAILTLANLSGASLFSADLSGAELSGANLSKTLLIGANLSGAGLYEADLSGAGLRGADLSGAGLHGADLKDCILDSATRLPLIYEPKAGSPPYIPSMANLPNLKALTFKKSPHGLVDLREGFKKWGYRKQEREITYAIKHTQRRQLWNYSKKGVKDTEGTESEKDSQKSISIWDKFEGIFYLLFFELTCQYGMKPGRPLIILICLIPFFSFLYIFALKTKRQKTGLWLIFLKERVLKATKEERSFKLTAKFPPRVTPTRKLNKIKLRILRSYRMIRIGLYFSLLSATNIGWRELNIGNWISRLQRREYTLRATGWVRTVSGLQSLISVYLLALWALTYFGRPFEAI